MSGPLYVAVKSGTQLIGRLTPAEFRGYVGQFLSSNRVFLSAQVADFNAMKTAAGEPERAEIILERSPK